MAKFELQTLTNYDNQSLIVEMQRVANLLPAGKINRAEFDRLSKVHSSTVSKRFGSWRKALEVAGLDKQFNDQSEAWTREEIVQQMQTVSRKLNRTIITQRDLIDHTGITHRPIKRLFGSLKKALVAAGLSQSPLGMRYTDEECYENLLDVWTALGRQPFYSEMKTPPSRVGPKAYVLRWGGWRNALAAFIERVNQDIPDEPTIKSESVIEPSVASSPKRTSRDIPLGLRYKILSRDRFRCVIDGKSPATHFAVTLHVDHIKPWSKGGETVAENLRTLCSDCNLGKGASIE
jgi:hypothetical protein